MSIFNKAIVFNKAIKCKQLIAIPINFNIVIKQVKCIIPAALYSSGDNDDGNNKKPLKAISKIYTRTGDKGRSALFTGERRDKDDVFFKALGDLDELSSYIGLADSLCEECGVRLEVLREIQCVLQDVASAVATPLSSARPAHISRTHQLPSQLIKDLEQNIDFFSNSLPPLTNFILPSGGKAGCALHVARSICRRAERSVTAVNKQGEIPVEVGAYLNRLSDLLFTLGRYVSSRLNKPELVYKRVERHIHINTYREYSTLSGNQRPTSSNEFNVTLDNVFSEVNKTRVTQKFGTLFPIPRNFSEKNPKKAGVIIPLCRCDDQPSILFTLRSDGMAKHGGEVSFPGGMFDEAKDKDIIDTSVREMEEEIGVSRLDVDLWGEMSTVPSRDGKLAITAIVGYLGNVRVTDLKACDNEVEEVFCVSLSNLCDSNMFATTRFRTKRHYTLPVFLGSKYRIWGLTAIMLHQLLSVLASPGLYSGKIRHVPAFLQ